MPCWVTKGNYLEQGNITVKGYNLSKGIKVVVSLIEGTHTLLVGETSYALNLSYTTDEPTYE